MQLLDQYSPVAGGLLLMVVPLVEDMGWKGHAPGTLLGYHFTPTALVTIAISSVLGLVVSLSTFLFIGATSRCATLFCGDVMLVCSLCCGAW